MSGLTAKLALTASGIALVLLAGCGMPGTIASANRLPTAPPQGTPAPLPPVMFPQDEAPHRDLTEWWYYTGHLHGKDPRGESHAYGFELTVFQTLRGPFPPYYAAHYAISDLSRGQFQYDQRVQFGADASVPAAGSQNGFNLGVGGWTMQGLNGHDHLSAAMSGYAIDLHLVGTKPAVLHGASGIITLGQEGISYYYSRPVMSISGSLDDHGVAVTVAGTAWMDHQWGNFVSLAGLGWDWFSIQLDDNTEYMLYVIRDEQKRAVSVVGTYVGPDGTAHQLDASDIITQATGTWTSSVTHGQYPSGWSVRITSQQVALTLTPALADQELVTTQSTGVAYWEGTVQIVGTAGTTKVAGEGYVELTGYAAVPSATQTPSVP